MHHRGYNLLFVKQMLWAEYQVLEQQKDNATLE